MAWNQRGLHIYRYWASHKASDSDSSPGCQICLPTHAIRVLRGRRGSDPQLSTALPANACRGQSYDSICPTFLLPSGSTNQGASSHQANRFSANMRKRMPTLSVLLSVLPRSELAGCELTGGVEPGGRALSDRAFTSSSSPFPHHARFQQTYRAEG